MLLLQGGEAGRRRKRGAAVRARAAVRWQGQGQSHMWSVVVGDRWEEGKGGCGGTASALRLRLPLLLQILLLLLLLMARSREQKRLHLQLPEEVFLGGAGGWIPLFVTLCVLLPAAAVVVLPWSSKMSTKAASAWRQG